jgi:hypothetical protein
MVICLTTMLCEQSYVRPEVNASVEMQVPPQKCCSGTRQCALPTQERGERGFIFGIELASIVLQLDRTRSPLRHLGRSNIPSALQGKQNYICRVEYWSDTVERVRDVCILKLIGLSCVSCLERLLLLEGKLCGYEINARFPYMACAPPKIGPFS